jgi:hypothetical protein
MPGLGRIKRKDFRDHAYLAAAHLPAVAPGVVRRRWFVPDCWDQKDTPQCVAYSSLMYLVAGPVRNTRLGSDYCAEFYRRCQAIDGDPAPHEGTTVRAAMQNLQSDGFLSAYLWAFDVRIVAQWILTKSPCVLGVDWLDSMFYTHDFKNSTFIKFDPSSAIVGGHALLAFAVDLNKKCPDGSTGAIELQNSWGQTWGNKGRAWLPFTAAAALLAEGGECATASEIVKR